MILLVVGWPGKDIWETQNSWGWRRTEGVLWRFSKSVCNLCGHVFETGWWSYRKVRYWAVFNIHIWAVGQLTSLRIKIGEAVHGNYLSSDRFSSEGAQKGEKTFAKIRARIHWRFNLFLSTSKLYRRLQGTHIDFSKHWPSNGWEGISTRAGLRWILKERN